MNELEKIGKIMYILKINNIINKYRYVKLLGMHGYYLGGVGITYLQKI